MKLASYIARIDGPEDLALVQWEANNNRIYDEDGDGIEDNRIDTHDELDKFYLPNVFGVAEDLHNTHHGNLPGHVQREFDLGEGEPADTYTLVKDSWQRNWAIGWAFPLWRYWTNCYEILLNTREKYLSGKINNKIN